MFLDSGLSLKHRVALAIWGLAVLVVLRLAFDVLHLSGAELAVVAVVVVVGSFYGIFRPLWLRLPEEWRRN
ncbi:hypothetical protein [Halobellus rubicundus]|uniref:Uncharacterized protein n=1 Tax=Halobellus rubicundus TaxID=2996466 RepID=A0ABD5MFQ4_9EURY